MWNFQSYLDSKWVPSAPALLLLLLVLLPQLDMQSGARTTESTLVSRIHQQLMLIARSRTRVDGPLPCKQAGFEVVAGRRWELRRVMQLTRLDSGTPEHDAWGRPLLPVELLESEQGFAPALWSLLWAWELLYQRMSVPQRMARRASPGYKCGDEPPLEAMSLDLPVSFVPKYGLHDMPEKASLRVARFPVGNRCGKIPGASAILQRRGSQVAIAPVSLRLELLLHSHA